MDVGYVLPWDLDKSQEKYATNVYQASKLDAMRNLVNWERTSCVDMQTPSSLEPQIAHTS